MFRGEDDRVVDEPVLVPLDRAHHRGLRGGRLVVVNDTNTAKELEGHKKSDTEPDGVSAY